MISKNLDDLNILSERVLPTPDELKSKFPLSSEAERCVIENRDHLRRILDGKDTRIFVVAGPCSIHDAAAAKEYAHRLKALSDRVKSTMLLIMRTYFEKPRTVTGWKGYINDPFLDDSFSITEGLMLARELVLEISVMGLPVANEALDPIIPQYLSDLITWTAIGARTTESQTHRELASGLSTPVGFKNATDGSIEAAVNAIRSASSPHCFLGITQAGQCAVMQTKGNRYGHLVLRGGMKPNYDSDAIALSEWLLQRAGLRPNIVVDCSHGNSLKEPTRQPLVFRECIRQRKAGAKSIVGLMLESNLNAGRQDVPDDVSGLAYGVSITDACIDWETTEELILAAHDELEKT